MNEGVVDSMLLVTSVLNVRIWAVPAVKVHESVQEYRGNQNLTARKIVTRGMARLKLST